VLTDRLLDGARPRGYAAQQRNHAVAAAIRPGMRRLGHDAGDDDCQTRRLGFLPMQEERYDFVVLDHARLVRA
jgi:putative molybdopterin biosynthesis protein